ncbi:LLM class flavin-dependent oxidoreductase [Amycolatopsis sp. NPDC003865]
MTVYLHWKNREELFLAVLLRESVRGIEDLVRAVDADPLAARLSTLTELQYANVLGRPLLRAGHADDAGTLGKLLPKLHAKLDPRHDEAFVEYLELLAANDLLRTDRPARDLAVAYRAVLHGFLVGTPPPPPALIADTVAHAFEPVAVSTMRLRAIAPRVVALFTESAALDRKQRGGWDALTALPATGVPVHLGVGLSHRYIVEREFGYSYDRPLRRLREYLEALNPLLRGDKADVHGDSLTAAGELADGVITTWAGPRAIGEFVVPALGTGRRVVTGQARTRELPAP